MENVNLFLLRLILTAVVLNVVAAKKAKETIIAHRNEDSSEVASLRHDHHDFYLNPTLDEEPRKRKHGKKPKKAKRETYGRYGKWSSKSSNAGYGSEEYSGSLPLYLVFNRKVGAYYPFYKYPKESHRRSSNYRRVPLD
ncbi:hypothetical protein O0L34_g7888 [Tuta absoluta]|nr:hypothetical protein O0L34_g7888 [Tuta absoluta]